MSDPKSATHLIQPTEAKALTRAAAAKLVRRPATKAPGAKSVAVEAAEVLSFKDYGTHVVVVTADGQKLSSADE